MNLKILQCYTIQALVELLIFLFSVNIDKWVLFVSPLSTKIRKQNYILL